MMVMLNHVPHDETKSFSLIRPIVAPFNVGYWSGVDLFFVLSGFLVGGLLISELRTRGEIDLKRFWIRRGLKIWPSYYLYLAYLVVLTAFVYVDRTVPRGQLTALMVHAKKFVYLQNYASFNKPPALAFGPGTHTWTLAVEEHFYLLLPLLLVISGKRWRTILPVVSIALLVVCLAIRLRSFHQPMNWTWDYQVTHKRIDALFFGVLLVFLSQTRPGFLAAVGRWRPLVGVAGLMLIAPMFFIPLDSGFVKTFGYLLLSLGYGCILLTFVSSEPGHGLLGRALATRPARALAWVGFWSYSIYLWHMEIVSLMNSGPVERWFDGYPSDFRLLVYLTAAIGVGVLMGRLIEKPALMWRERYFPSRSPNSPVPEPAVAEDQVPGVADGKPSPPAVETANA